jgi:hypothetical protein
MLPKQSIDLVSINQVSKKTESEAESIIHGVLPRSDEGCKDIAHSRGRLALVSLTNSRLVAMFVIQFGV